MQWQFNGRALEATFSSQFNPVVTDQIKPCAELWLLCLERKPPSQTVPCWVTQQGMTFLPFVFQTQSLQMEAFSTQTKPTIKTDDLFYHPNQPFYHQNPTTSNPTTYHQKPTVFLRLLNVKPNVFLLSKPTFYGQNQPPFTFKTDDSTLSKQTIKTYLKFINTVKLPSKQNPIISGASNVCTDFYHERTFF